MARAQPKVSEGWIQDPDGHWSMHFYLDPKSWKRYPFIFLDKGRAMEDGSPALLKSRRHLPKADAIEVWNHLIAAGWKRVQPQWGIYLDP